MNLLTVENISRSYGETELFSGISFGINKDRKIALIAKNGTGKTSILNIISGAEKPDSGVVSYRKDIRISYLEQEPKMNADLTIEETIFASDNEVLKVISNAGIVSQIEYQDDYVAPGGIRETSGINNVVVFPNPTSPFINKL